VAIAYQPAMTKEAVPIHPPARHPDPRRDHRAPADLARSSHEVVLVEAPVLAWTVTKIIGLLAITAMCAAVVVAIVAGGALFAISTIG
jgi:hypothetical protein